ncbi:hypothetical protein CPLU01_06111 [Colletotrichum plurivorum]|uniref:Uncharacterized protein n=1 Tax=Colletotrichum plurivorum TaxID=2175906 RepID=A0A8H6KJ78_9PEZI|nr:hypothetical protein CPLU01_06111 [Colletotrichum plurivorum]
MSTNIASILFTLGDIPSVYNSSKDFMWPEILYNICPQDFSAPQTVTVPLVKGKGLTDFESKCGGPSMLNSAPDTYNCAALSIAATLAQNHKFSLDDSSVRKADEALGFGDLMSFNATGTLEQIVGCASNSCGGSGMTPEQTKLLEKEYGKCSHGIGNLSPSSVDSEDLKVILDPLRSLCSNAITEVEADIAGPGPDETRLRSTLARLRSSRFSTALFSTIIEFQETQLFLTLALQLATMFMVAVNEDLSSAVDLRAARAITSGQTFMALLTQIIMQRRGLHWWYTVILTLIVGGMAIMIRVRIQSKVQLQSLPSTSGCGKSQASILELCPSGGGGDRMRFSQEAVFDHVVLYAVTMFVLVVDQLRQLPWVVSKLERLREGKKSRAPIIFYNSLSVFWNLGWLALTFFLFYSLLFNASFIFKEVGETLNKMEKWTFGQVVAVLPWAPVVAKYIYYNIYGIESGVGNRIDHHYKIVRDRSFPETDSKQSDKRSLVSDEYISLRSVGGDSRRTGDPEAVEWGRRSPAEGGLDGDLGSRVSRTTNP